MVGGGIAGCAACLALAKRGVKAIWIAPEDTSASKPGESLAAAARALLDDLDLAHVLDDPAHRRSQLSFTSWGSDALLERHAAAQPGGMGHVLNRRHFEAALLAQTRLSPDIVRLDDTLREAERTATGWHLTTGGGQTIGARLVIDATGRRAMIGRREARPRRLDRLVAAVSFLRQSAPDIDPTPATLTEAVAGGWWYATLLADRRLAINFYSDPDLLPRRIGQRLDLWQHMVRDTRYIWRWLESAGYEPSEPPQLATAGTVWLETAAGSDWLAAGDAAISFDPLSAHGMTTALWTGIQAAQAAALTLDGDASALAGYAARLRAGVERFAHERRNIYSREMRFAHHPFWRRRQTEHPE